MLASTVRLYKLLGKEVFSMNQGTKMVAESGEETARGKVVIIVKKEFKNQVT